MRWVSRTGGEVLAGAGDRGVRVSKILVGRDDLLALAERRLGSVRAGSGHLLFLAGEAGVGKTRLLRELADRASASGFTIVRAAAFPRDIEITGGALADPHHGAAPLTARELEVARLIATGATNRQIAATLYIAPKTVAAHVEHILTKLGATRRTEIAAWAASQHFARTPP
jgi:DNA-binding CsgD family transcriptional regulator